ncbi:MAG TPA: cytochrome c oxidase subunit II [Candidatus Dormibacteraeota bacterium]|jgi:cytochrome c oxidase subunit 2|nr:cytochrome c oxidase subunit II [Candidatus Dormibacteraeota bacterium]
MSTFRIEAADRPHAIRLAIIWVVLSVLGIIAVLQIQYPPYDQTVQGQDQSRTLALLTAIATPVFIGVVILIVYSAIYFRRSGPELVDGPPMKGNTPVQVVWISVSAIIVLFLAFVGITTLATNSSAQTVPGQSGSLAGGTAGNAGSEMQVQVIAQQWYFTYRYADYGGVETTHLYLPVDRPVELHVTSLDIIHSFWAYQLGVKADANPGVDNVFHVTPQKTGSFQVRCAELCGLWHGQMSDAEGQVVSQSDFDTWIAQQQQDYAAIQKVVPSYAPYYFPLPLTKGS